MHFLFLSKDPVSEPPPGSPTGLLWRELLVYRTFFTYHIPHKNFPKLRNFSLLSKALGKERPSMFPKRGGPYGNRRPLPEPHSYSAPSFIFQRSQYTSPLPGSSVGNLGSMQDVVPPPII